MSLAASFAQTHGAHIRLAVLQLLAEMPGYRAGELVLHPAVEALGLGCTRDQLRGHLAWLGEQDLVRVEGAAIATLTERGHEVARGAAVVPGVERPAPGR